MSLSFSEILRCDPSSSPHCFGKCKPSSAGSHRRRCGNKISASSVARATQVLETGAALFKADEPLRQCLQQLAPLVLCVRYHQDQADELIKAWWWRILDEHENEGPYVREMESVFKAMEAVGELDEGYLESDEEEEEEDEEEEDEERDEGGKEEDEDGPQSTTAKTKTTTSTTDSLPARPCLTPRSPKQLQIKRYSRARFAKLNGLAPNHVFPKLPVPEECGICLETLAPPHVSNANGTAASTSTSPSPPNAHKSTTGNKPETRKAASVDKQEKVPSDDQHPADLWADYDCVRWIWCKKSCGITYHKDCLNQWVNTVRFGEKPSWPTCPTCRSHWVF